MKTKKISLSIQYSDRFEFISTVKDPKKGLFDGLLVGTSVYGNTTKVTKFSVDCSFRLNIMLFKFRLARTVLIAMGRPRKNLNFSGEIF